LLPGWKISLIKEVKKKRKIAAGKEAREKEKN